MEPRIIVKCPTCESSYTVRSIKDMGDVNHCVCCGYILEEEDKEYVVSR